MIHYHHNIITHGKALAECLAEHRAVSDLKYRRSFRFVENSSGGWNLVPWLKSEPLVQEESCHPEPSHA